MSIYRPRKPSNGKGAPSQFLMFCISVWEMLFNGKFPFQDTNTIKWKCGAAGYSAQWVNPGSSSGGKGGGDIWAKAGCAVGLAASAGWVVLCRADWVLSLAEDDAALTGDEPTAKAITFLRSDLTFIPKKVIQCLFNTLGH